MNPDTIRIFGAGGIFMLLLLLRLEAKRFGAAEFDEPGLPRAGVWTRFSWYAIGLALLAALYVVHPAPHDVLYLLAGQSGDIAANGAILAALGLALAAGLAWLRYGYLRLPAAGAYPGAALNSVATAVVDELTFRGALLGTLVWIGYPAAGAIAIETLIYILVTRAAAPGRHYSVVAMAAFFGGIGGWATLASGGLGGAVIGHAVTSFGVFVCTGHAGQLPRDGREPEEAEFLRRPPAGWYDVRVVPETSDLVPVGPYRDIRPSGFSNRAEHASTGRSGGLLGWIAAAGRTATGHTGDRHTAERGARPTRPASGRSASGRPAGGPAGAAARTRTPRRPR
jgi:Type II CAAX prenyl endopeptidase Rce1-like